MVYCHVKTRDGAERFDKEIARFRGKWILCARPHREARLPATAGLTLRPRQA
jgi:hypothetical protein